MILSESVSWHMVTVVSHLQTAVWCCVLCCVTLTMLKQEQRRETTG